MADKSLIEWTEATWNPITGCSVISPGCTNCYAMRLAGTRLKHHESRKGLTEPSKAGPVWTGEVRLNEQWLDQPMRWKRPRMIFVCAHGDLFHETVPDEWIDKIFAVMALSRHHVFQVLTKRADRMRSYLDGYAAWVRVERLIGDLKPSSLWNGSHYEAQRILQSGQPLPNVWVGVSAENHEWAYERLPELDATHAALHWVSAEPLVGPIDFDRLALGCLPDWIVVGGESGRNARSMDPDWAREIRDFCKTYDVPFFM
ncbi:MAG: phage Gp37/Gp68 family protein, partial [Pseudomonadota bacterium]